MRPDRRYFALLVALTLIVPAAAVVVQAGEAGDGGDGGEGDDGGPDLQGEDGPEGDGDGDGDDSDDDGADADDDRSELRREVDDVERKVEVDGHKASVELKREDNATEDKVELTLDTEDAALEVKFEAEEGDAETERKLEATFHVLLEYEDANANGAFDAGEPVASAWLLSDDADADDVDALEDLAPNGTVAWDLPVVTDVASNDGTPGKQISANATFGPDGNATFGLDMRVYGDFALEDDFTLEPTEAKIDIRVDGYPFERNDTALALMLTTEAKTELDEDHDDIDRDQTGVVASDTLGDRVVNLTFTWSDNATVDGASTAVHTTLLEFKEETETEMDAEGNATESKVEKTFALSYARGDAVVHDPVMGVSYSGGETATVGPLPFAGPAAVVAGVVLAALFVARARRWRDG